MIVSIIKAFAEWFKISLSKYDIAMLAYKIERKDLKLVGGVQDQFSASYGGFSYIEIKKPILLMPLFKQKIDLILF